MAATFRGTNDNQAVFGSGTHAERPITAQQLPTGDRRALVFYLESDTAKHFLWDWGAGSWVETDFVPPGGGPAGPAGATGATGATGPAGSSGTAAFVAPPAASTWTWANQAGAARADVANGVLLTGDTGVGGDNVTMLVRSLPAAPYTVTAAFYGAGHRQSIAGLVLYDTGSTKILMHCKGDFSSPLSTQVFALANPTTFSASYVNGGASWHTGPFWLRIADNGTTWIFSISADGISWTVIFTVARNDFLTPDSIGFGIDNLNTTVAAVVTLVSWAVA